MLLHIGESTPFSYFFFDLEYAGSYPINFPAWYVSSLLLCSIIIHYLYFNHKKCFVSVIAPVMIILIYGRIYRSFTSLNVGGDVGTFFNEYYLRGFAGMSVGVICFYILDKIKDYKFSISFWILMRIVEIVSMILFTWIGLMHGEQKTDMVLLVILFIGAFCSFIHPAYARKSTMSEIIKKASSYTYACYLNHIFVGLVIGTLSESMPIIDNLVCYYAFIIFLSVFTHNVLQVWGKQCRKLKKLFVIN